jgi:uncharacterized repeat protein (TIGR02543 family)
MKNVITALFMVFLFSFLVSCKGRFEIKFVDYDDSVIEIYNLDRGEKIIAPTVPEREGYSFIGWDKEFDLAAESITIKAVYEKSKFTVKFIGFDDEVLKEEIVEYGNNATAPEYAGNEQFEFKGWDKDYTNVKSDLDVKATSQIRKFTVKFYGNNNELLKEEVVEYGKNATAPTVPTIEGFTFKAWDEDYTNVQSNLDVNAIYEEKEYSIKFYDGSTELNLGITKYKKSDNFALPIPTKTGYEFAGWFLSEISMFEITEISDKLNGDLKLYSRWVSTKSENLVAPVGGIEFVSIKKNPHSSGTGYVYQPEFPVGAKSTSVLAYNWASSNTKVATISAYSSISIVSSGYAIITGTLISDNSYVLYCVIQTTPDGVFKASLEEANAINYVYATFIIDEATRIRKVVAKGGSVIPPTAKEKEGYVFAGWVGENGEDIYNITKDTTYTAKYLEGTNSYAGKTVSILGDSITTFLGYIPNGFAYFYPYPTAGFGDVNQTWWMQLINHTGMKLLANNSWSGSAVAGTAASAGQNIDRLKHLYIGDVVPDVIIIFMGANDAPSPYITLNEFDVAYGKMIKNIKEKAPNAEIIVCTLPDIPLYTLQAQDEYNEVIRKYAQQNNFKIIDFDSAFTREQKDIYLVDSAHPSKTGMIKLAEVALNDLAIYKDKITLE